MIAKHVHATVIADLHRYGRDPSRPETERNEIQGTLARCLPRRVELYLFEGGELRQGPFDFNSLRDLVLDNVEDLTAHATQVFEQGWPEPDADVTTPAPLRAHIEASADNLETVAARLRRRLARMGHGPDQAVERVA